MKRNNSVKSDCLDWPSMDKVGHHDVNCPDHHNGFLLIRNEQKCCIISYFFDFAWDFLVLELKRLKHSNFAFFWKTSRASCLLAKSMGTKNMFTAFTKLVVPIFLWFILHYILNPLEGSLLPPDTEMYQDVLFFLMKNDVFFRYVHAVSMLLFSECSKHVTGTVTK